MARNAWSRADCECGHARSICRDRLPSNALWLDIGYEQFIEVGGTENMTIQLVGLGILLLLTALCAGIALFADSLRRKKE